MSSNGLKKIFSNNTQRKLYYGSIIKGLKEASVIEVKEYYNPERHEVKGYRLAEEYLSSFHYITIKKNKKTPANRRDCPHHYENLKKLSVDKELLQRIKDRLYYSEKLWKYQDLSLDRLIEDDIYVIKDDHGRVHSNFTNLKKIFRGCLKYGNHRLVTVDISNEFQFFLIEPLLRFVGENFDEVPEDVQNYIDCVCNGEFIEAIKAVMNVTCDWDEYLEDLHSIANKRKRRKYMTKGDLKNGLFAKCFFNPHRKTLNPFSKAFSKLFPTVWYFLKECKLFDYKGISRYLQGLESKVMNDALQSLYKRYPSAFFLRLHDCVVTCEGLENEVQNEIKTACQKYIGYTPQSKCEPLEKHTNEILTRDPNSPMFKLFELYELGKKVKEYGRSVCRKYKGRRGYSEDAYQFETYHHKNHLGLLKPHGA
jgi:hypothetical protein